MTVAPPTSDLQDPAGLEPLQLLWSLHLSPEQFELAADGQLIATTPTGSETSARNSNLVILLGLALQRSGLPYKIFDSSGGFRLSDGSVLSPDQRRGFAPVCPDLVIDWPARQIRLPGV